MKLEECHSTKDLWIGAFLLCLGYKVVHIDVAKPDRKVVFTFDVSAVRGAMLEALFKKRDSSLWVHPYDYMDAYEHLKGLVQLAKKLGFEHLDVESELTEAMGTLPTPPQESMEQLKALVEMLDSQKQEADSEDTLDFDTE